MYDRWQNKQRFDDIAIADVKDDFPRVLAEGAMLLDVNARSV